MDDLISRQAAIDAMAELQGRASSKGELTGISKAWKRIKKLPTIQPERAEGEWVLKDYLWECNKCGCRINVKNPLCDNNWNYYFCPHCGTKMTIAVQRF